MRVEFGELEAIHPFQGTSGKTHPTISSSTSSILLLSTRLHIHTTEYVAVVFIPGCLLENCLYSSWRYYPTPTSSCLLLAWFGLLPFDKKCLYTWIAFTMSSCIITPYHNLQSPTGDHQSHHRAVGHVVWSTTNGEISTESTIRIEI